MHIRIETLDHRHGVAAIGGFTDHLYVLCAAENRLYSGADDRMIVSEYHTNDVCGHSMSSLVCNSVITLVPPFRLVSIRMTSPLSVTRSIIEESPFAELSDFRRRLSIAWASSVTSSLMVPSFE